MERGEEGVRFVGRERAEPVEPDDGLLCIVSDQYSLGVPGRCGGRQ